MTETVESVTLLKLFIQCCMYYYFICRKAKTLVSKVIEDAGGATSLPAVSFISIKDLRYSFTEV